MTSEIKYPKWLNICSLISLLLIVAGFISLMFIDPTTALCLFGLGFLGFAVFGHIGSVYKSKYLFNMRRTDDER